MATTTTTQVPAAVKAYYDRVVLITAYPALVHTRFAQHKVLPKKNSEVAVFRTYDRLETVTVPLNEAVTPPGTQLSLQDIKVTVQQYGNFITVSDWVQLTVEDEVLNRGMALLGQNLAQTMDEITRDVLVNTATSYGCAFGSNGETPTNMTKEDFDVIVKNLMNNDAMMITEVIKGSDYFGTSPVRAAYWAYMHTELLDDLENVSNFQDNSRYSRDETLDGEWGSVGNIRILPSSVAYKSSAATPVYSVPIVGQEAYGVVSLGSNMGEMIVNPLGSAGASDPLAQRATIGYKIPFAARMLNDAFAYVMLTTHS